MPARWTLNKDIFRQNAKSVLDKSPVFAVVKNNAYNFGLEFSVKEFSKIGIHHFATTSLEEAIKIRKLNQNAIIFLMNPYTEFDVLKAYNIQMTLPSIDFLKRYKKHLNGITLHLEYEGLLNRSGLKELAEFIDVLENYPDLDIKGLWTHFGYADELDCDEYETERNDWLFIVEHLLKLNYSFEYIHAQNSASLYREDKLLPHHTHSRIGIALYGSKPYASLDNTQIIQSLTVTANVLQIRTLQKGEHSGYSFTFKAKRDNTKIAVVDIGYGDGILKTRAEYHCKINHTNYPIKGLMMSHLLVEVDDQVEEGDEVTLYSNQDDLRIGYFTALGVGANSEQLSALNHDSLIKEFQ